VGLHQWNPAIDPHLYHPGCGFPVQEVGGSNPAHQQPHIHESDMDFLYLKEDCFDRVISCKITSQSTVSWQVVVGQWARSVSPQPFEHFESDFCLGVVFGVKLVKEFDRLKQKLLELL
jgi:hypothetical protein